MRYLALCTDYDGTLASDGRVLPETLAALERLITSGKRRLVLVTGRELDELKSVFPRLDLFEYVVAENGALLYEPATGTETPLAQRPPDSFVAALRAHGVGPISVGRVIVATWEPHETAVLRTIRDQGLELQVIFNKGAVMVLPAGVNKATGLAAALEKMALSAHNAVAIGDAENDHALIRLCECGVAVANALPTLKEEADFVTRADHGAGVAELIDALLEDDLASRDAKLVRHHILLGHAAGDREVRISPYGQSMLLVGPRGGSTVRLAGGLLQRLAQSGYTFCVIAPHADYEGQLPDAVSLGSQERPPLLEEILKLLRRPERSVIVNVAGLRPSARPEFAARLIPELAQLQRRNGRPHWLTLEAIEGVPWPEGAAAPSVLHVAEDLRQMNAEALGGLDVVLIGGDAPERTLRRIAELTRIPMPQLPEMPPPGAGRLQEDEVLAWRPRESDPTPFPLRMAPPGTASVRQRAPSVASVPPTSRV